MALIAGALGVLHGGRGLRGSWFLLDRAGASFLVVIAVVGWCSAIVSPAYLAGAGKSLFTARRARAWYYTAFYLFWAALLALVLVDNLGVAWLLIEATTGASALLVAYSGRRSALEAGWKYLVLTTFGLAVALLGILILFVGLAPHGGTLATLDWQSIARHVRRHGSPDGAVRVDPDPRRAGREDRLGAGAQLAARRAQRGAAAGQRAALRRAAADGDVDRLACRADPRRGGSAPSREQPHARLRAGLAGGRDPVSVAADGVEAAARLLEPRAHGNPRPRDRVRLAAGDCRGDHPPRRARPGQVARASTPRSRCCATTPRAHSAAPRGLAALSTPVAAAAGISLGTLSGLPPSPLFFSELLILLGGIAAHQVAVVSIAAVLMALGFLGLAHALIETLAGESRGQRWQSGRTVRLTGRLTVALTLGLLALSAGAYLLAGSHVGAELMAGVA